MLIVADSDGIEQQRYVRWGNGIQTSWVAQDLPVPWIPVNLVSGISLRTGYTFDCRTLNGNIEFRGGIQRSNYALGFPPNAPSLWVASLPSSIPKPGRNRWYFGNYGGIGYSLFLAPDGTIKVDTYGSGVLGIIVDGWTASL